MKKVKVEDVNLMTLGKMKNYQCINMSYEYFRSKIRNKWYKWNDEHFYLIYGDCVITCNNDLIFPKKLIINGNLNVNKEKGKIDYSDELIVLGNMSIVNHSNYFQESYVDRTYLPKKLLVNDKLFCFNGEYLFPDDLKVGNIADFSFASIVKFRIPIKTVKKTTIGFNPDEKEFYKINSKIIMSKESFDSNLRYFKLKKLTEDR